MAEPKQSRSNHQLINQTSGKVEYYTPVEIVEAARRVMGGIDLDPASSIAANLTVKALHIFTVADDGLSQEWHGRIWMNHPFGLVQNPKWVTKIGREYYEGRIRAACCITFACTSERWFQPLAKLPQCYLTPRTNYRLPDGTIKKGVSKGSVVTYYGNDIDRFAREFIKFGVVKVTHATTA